MAKKDLWRDGLPAALDVERFVLGTAMIQPKACEEIFAKLTWDVFALEAHRRIFLRMKDLADAGVQIDRITLMERLAVEGQLDSVGGLSKLMELDQGLPELPNVTAYIDILLSKSARRRLIFAAEELGQLALDETIPTENLITLATKRMAEVVPDQEDITPKSVMQFVDTFPGGVDALLNPSLTDKGLETGFLRIDELTGGFHESEIWVLGARPSMGKSTCMLNIAENISSNGSDYGVAVFSLEMPVRNLINRMLCKRARIGMKRLRSGELLQEERYRVQAALSEIYDLPLYMDHLSGMSVQEMQFKLKVLRDKCKIVLVCVDYLQLMRPISDRGSANDRLTQITTDIQSMAVETKLPFLILSQMNRLSEQRGSRGKNKDFSPQLSDLRDSGSIEQFGNIIPLLHLPAFYDPSREELKDRAELNFAKNRDGERGKVDLRFTGWQFKFEDA